ncbi:hypothetical protein [Halobellus litoreus]|uniref:Uncharacterized protein n=1 Tax=Halobellus litoreus TaxID=755310 RepID=A0ABD6DZX6_9EURY|nr:hypothetical protein [Halobellus litoreus]
MIFGAERAVLYLEKPVETLQAIDGSRRQGIRSSIEKLLDSPDSAFDKSVGSHIHQARDLGTYTRAFCTWCVDEDASRELCVVQAIYGKGNEAKYFEMVDRFDQDGKQWKQQFQELPDGNYDEWAESIESNGDLILVRSD